MSDNAKMRFALRLKELREKRGLSQAALARNLSLSQSAVAGWETCKREPVFDTLELLADFFGVSADYLLGRTDSPLSIVPKETPYIECTPFERQVFEAYRAMSETEQAMVCRMLGLTHPVERRSKASRA